METHKAMLANVIKYLGPGLLEQDLECLVVPGVTTGQVEVPLRYCRCFQVLGMFAVHLAQVVHSNSLQVVFR